MADDAIQELRGKCTSCGYEAPAGGDGWDSVEHPSLGRMTRCPDCGSTNVTSRPG